jgi:hypothetical protein
MATHAQAAAEPNLLSAKARQLPVLSAQLEMLMRMARELAAMEGAERADINHLRKLLFSQRVAVMLELARAIDEAPAADKRRLTTELAKAEESFRLSLQPPQSL